MHVELDAITQLANALMYATHACQELNVNTPVTRRLYTDSEAAQSHCLNNSASKKSKHMEMRLQAVQDFQADDRIDVIHVAGGENCADQGTKSLDPEKNLKHMIFILGHRMMPGKGIEGVQEVVPSEIAPVMAAYLEAKSHGYVDITENTSYCSSIEPSSCALCHSAFFLFKDCSSVIDDGESPHSTDSPTVSTASSVGGGSVDLGRGSVCCLTGDSTYYSVSASALTE